MSARYKKKSEVGGRRPACRTGRSEDETPLQAISPRCLRFPATCHNSFLIADFLFTFLFSCKPGVMIQPDEMKLNLPMELSNGVISTTTQVWKILTASHAGNITQV